MNVGWDVGVEDGVSATWLEGVLDVFEEQGVGILFILCLLS